MRPLAALATLVLLAPLAASAAGDIQPGGDYNDICTLNFVFDGKGPLAGRVFIGTAAHCVEEVGESASTVGARAFGTVVYTGDFDGDRNGIPGQQSDFALIEVKPAFHARVVAHVAGHPDAPRGHTTSGTTAQGDVLRVSGHGMGFHLAAQTRESRVGVLVRDTPTSFVADTMAVWGDSGGPLLHEDGRALGVISQYALGELPPATDEGPTVEGILAELAALGWPVALRSVG